jgi:hypothetical protein
MGLRWTTHGSFDGWNDLLQNEKEVRGRDRVVRVRGVVDDRRSVIYTDLTPTRDYPEPTKNERSHANSA